ncbi:MAG: PilZ domain-containing protein [Candidatus Omnitrophica bacterium]|nr:PilZ domain-containing protein [Candidatus Omnitrophota bacterium]MBU1924532.1 PilZ domain-containing protein [Candidatus Omnitrophota bacterium]
MEQRRIHKRIEDLVEVEFILESAGVTETFKTKTRDLSAGGVKVFLNRRLPADEEMKMKVTLPDAKKTVETKAVVVSSELTGVVDDTGKDHLYETRFKFTHLRAEDASDIIHYIYNCRKREQEANRKKNL